MAKIPIILEPGRADGKLVASDSIFDKNKNKFQNKINQEVEERLNDVKDTLNSDSTTTPLSAKQGKVLKDLLDSKVIETGSIPIDSEPILGNTTHIVNSDGLAKEFNKCNTTIINTDRIANEAIVPSKLSTDIQSLISNLSKTATFAGIATPTTNPSTPDGPVFYIAKGKGTYTNFGGIDITEDEVVVLYYDNIWHKNITGIASKEKLTELDEIINGEHINLLDGAEWEVGRIFNGKEINTTEYPSYRVLKFNCESGDKIIVAATYTPTPDFIGYIREDNTVKAVVAGTGGAIEETTIDCVSATYVICETINGIAHITKLEKIKIGLPSMVTNLENTVEDNISAIAQIQSTLEPIDKKVNGGINTTDIKPTLEWKDGRVFTSGINTESYTDYKYAEIECKEGDKIRIAASYTPSSSVFLGYKNDSKITQLIAGTGTGIDEQIFECINATYVVCQYYSHISSISVLEKTVKTDSEFEKLHKELTDEIVKKIDDAPIDSKPYIRKDGEWQELSKKEEPIVTDLLNSVEWKNGRVVGTWIDTSVTYSKLCEIEITKDGDELIVASNTSGPANVPFLSKKTDATHATNIISSTDGGAISEQRIVCEKGVYIVCIYSHPTTDVTVLTKIEYPLDEQKEENKRNRGFLYGKTIASIGDSLATSGLWQNELVKKGAIFDAEKNYTAGQLNYSEGGTVTCDVKDANCGHIRARRLVEDGIVIPDIIFIENVNDSRLAPPPNHDTPSNIDDEPFFLTDVINYATTYNSKQDAITAWNNNFASIVGTVTAKKGVAFLLKYKVSAKVFTINSAPTQNGYIEITATGNDVKRITLTTSDTIATVIEKILAYDYSGWTDNKKLSNAVIFSPSITGDVDITANTCGLTFTKTTEESTNSIARCFCSVDVSKWNDKIVWKDNPGLFASYKGIVEYLQTAFPTAQIVFFIPETWGFDYNASIYKRADGTIDVDKIAKSYNYVGYLYNLQKQFCERYNLRVIDVRGKCGANYINISQFNAPDEVHPKKLGYQRWGEQIVRELN